MHLNATATNQKPGGLRGVVECFQGVNGGSEHQKLNGDVLRNFNGYGW